MRSIFTLSLLWLINSNIGTCCDVCGVSSGSNLVGILPRYQSHFIGIRHKVNQFYSYQTMAMLKSNRAKDVFQQYEIFGKYQLNKKWQLYSTIPLVLNQSTINELDYRITGLGDIGIGVGHIFFNTNGSSDSKYTHSLLGIVGFQIPTGKQIMYFSDFTKVNLNMQAGLGAWSASINANYTLRGNNWGLNTDSYFKTSGVSQEDEKAGEKFQQNIRIFKVMNNYSKNLSLLPAVGFYFEHSAKDFDIYSAKVKKSHSGLDAIQISSGLDLYWKNVAFNILVKKPIKQSVAGGLARSRFYIQSGINFFINKQKNQKNETE